LAKVLLGEVAFGSDREVKHVDWIPTLDRVEAWPQRSMISGEHLDVGSRAMCRLVPGAVGTVVLGAGITDANGHPLGEEVISVRTRREVAPHAAHAPVARGHSGQHLLERAAAG